MRPSHLLEHALALVIVLPAIAALCGFAWLLAAVVTP